MTAKDIREFNLYLAQCTNDQVVGVWQKETDAGREDYAELARTEAMHRGSHLKDCRHAKKIDS